MQMRFEVLFDCLSPLWPKCLRMIDFASCALNRTISATWACRTERLAMNSCMVSHATQYEQDAARAEWFATKDLRLQQMEEKEKRKRDQEKFYREWWGLPQMQDEGDSKAEDVRTR